MQKNSTAVVSLLVGVILAVAVGVACGLALVWHLSRSGYSTNSGMLIWALAMLAFVLALLLQIIIHELGHLFFGLLSGYGFCSLQLASMTILIDADGKLSHVKASNSPMISQCLMSPPDIEEDGYLPAGLYIMGGVIFNAFTAIIFLWAYFVGSGTKFLPFFYLSMNVVGLGLALINLIPFSLGGHPNDAYVAHYLDDDDETVTFAYWAQLKINQQLVQGKQLKDMPDELFKLPNAGKHHNPIVSAAELLIVSCRSR